MPFLINFLNVLPLAYASYVSGVLFFLRNKWNRKKKESSDLVQSCFEALYKAKSNRMNLRFL